MDIYSGVSSVIARYNLSTVSLDMMIDTDLFRS